MKDFSFNQENADNAVEIAEPVILQIPQNVCHVMLTTSYHQQIFVLLAVKTAGPVSMLTIQTTVLLVGMDFRSTLLDLVLKDAPKIVSPATTSLRVLNAYQDSQLTGPINQSFALRAPLTAELAHKANHQCASIVELDFI